MFKELLSAVAGLMTAPASIWRAFALLTFMGFALWTCDQIPGVTGVGFARAQELSKLNTRLDDIEIKQNIALRLQLADEICRLVRLRADAPEGELLAQLNRSYEARQVEYAGVNGGMRYPITDCVLRD